MSNIPLKISIKNCKCFGEDEQSIDEIHPINLIIGKNNSGKSALLDVIQYVINPGSINLVRHKKNNPEVFLTKLLEDGEIQGVFRSDTHGGGVPGATFYEFGKTLIGKPITIKLLKEKKDFIQISPKIDLDDRVIDQQGFHKNLADLFLNPLSGRVFKKISAERDIVAESDAEIDLSYDGKGATNIIQRFINLASLGNREAVERELLEALNKIFAPEARFDRILTQQLDDQRWEIYLEERNKGIISLSNSGSGLKTVILVLINILLLPKYLGRNLSEFVFAFEELENNLHPSLQRKLLLYIRDIAIDNKCVFFLTTHSNVVIDLFGGDKEAQILHIVNDGITATAKKIQTFKDNNAVLDDLDFRASDLLQSNGVVWLEGPSDRTYFNHWVEIWSDGTLKEGIHYQCLLYGGRLLYHLTADEENLEDAVSILKINRNCILLMDSDKKLSSSKLGSTKVRIKKEIEAIGGVAWITKGREIENYIPDESIKNLYGKKRALKFDKFTDISVYLEKIKRGEGKKFERSKTLFAKDILPFITFNLVEKHLDIDKMMKKVINKIKEWNKL